MKLFILNKNNKTVLVGTEFKFYDSIVEVYKKETGRGVMGDIYEVAFELIDYGYNMEVVEDWRFHT